VASQLVHTAENGPTAHEAPVMVLFSSYVVFFSVRLKGTESALRGLRAVARSLLSGM